MASFGEGFAPALYNLPNLMIAKENLKWQREDRKIAEEQRVRQAEGLSAVSAAIDAGDYEGAHGTALEYGLTDAANSIQSSITARNTRDYQQGVLGVQRGQLGLETRKAEHTMRLENEAAEMAKNATARGYKQEDLKRLATVVRAGMEKASSPEEAIDIAERFFLQNEELMGGALGLDDGRRFSGLDLVPDGQGGMLVTAQIYNPQTGSVGPMTRGASADKDDTVQLYEFDSLVGIIDSLAHGSSVETKSTVGKTEAETNKLNAEADAIRMGGKPPDTKITDDADGNPMAVVTWPDGTVQSTQLTSEGERAYRMAKENIEAFTKGNSDIFSGVDWINQTQAKLILDNIAYQAVAQGKDPVQAVSTAGTYLLRSGSDVREGLMSDDDEDHEAAIAKLHDYALGAAKSITGGQAQPGSGGQAQPGSARAAGLSIDADIPGLKVSDSLADIGVAEIYDSVKQRFLERHGDPSVFQRMALEIARSITGGKDNPGTMSAGDFREFIDALKEAVQQAPDPRATMPAGRPNSSPQGLGSLMSDNFLSP